MTEPVSLSEAKAQLRKTATDEDGLITGYIVAAREWVENWTGHILAARQITETFLQFGDYLPLRYRPVTDLGDIFYTDVSGDDVEYEDGILRTSSYPAKVYPAAGTSFPQLGSDGLITVEYMAGYDAVPLALKQAMLLLIGHWFSMRGGVAPEPVQEVPLAVKSLCGPFRIPPLA